MTLCSISMIGTRNGAWMSATRTASVPIVNKTDTFLAAMTMCVPTSRMYPGRRDGLLADLIAAGEALSRDVAWLPAFDAKRV